MIEQIAQVDPQAADWLATLRASVDCTTVTPGRNYRGGMMGAFSKAQANEQERHLLCLAAFGHESSNDLTDQQCAALARWLDGGGSKHLGRIAAAVLKVQGQESLPGIDPVMEEAIKRGATVRRKGAETMAEHAEALFSATAKMTDPQGVEWLITVRDEQVPGDTATEKAGNCAKLTKYLLGHGWGRNGHDAARVAMNHPGNVEQGPPHPPAPTATAPAPPPSDGGDNVEVIDRVLITAPNGKPQVEFWRDGRKYPELKWNLGGEALMQVAPTLADAGWTAEHFDEIGREYPLALQVHWVPSPKNPKWKDVTGVVLVS